MEYPPSKCTFESAPDKLTGLEGGRIMEKLKNALSALSGGVPLYCVQIPSLKVPSNLVELPVRTPVSWDHLAQLDLDLNPSTHPFEPDSKRPPRLTISYSNFLPCQHSLWFTNIIVVMRQTFHPSLEWTTSIPSDCSKRNWQWRLSREDQRDILFVMRHVTFVCRQNTTLLTALKAFFRGNKED